MKESLYPPSIQGAPPELTIPSPAYRRQVVIVLLSLAVFILFYLGLLIGSGWVVIYAISQGMSEPSMYASRSENNWFFGLAVLAVILFLFLAKALFKWRKEREELRIEITQQEHPILFDFVRRICEDTRAPFPYRIFVTPDVNAAVFYNSSLLSLILPVKKNLLIGLGLVNGLNLSEFKAVLAHEFGHFAQSSMRLGSYVYMANHIIYDLVYRRDAFDDLLAKAKRLNIRIAIFAYAIYGVLWVLRKILQGAFHMINFFQSALSRQMEFHADLVSVSITGSDALIHALKKLEFVNGCLMSALSDLKDASEHQLFTQDIFYHQFQAVDHLRRAMKEPEAGTVPALPEDPAQKTQLFTREDDDTGSEGMWASHPSHYDREQNAKRVYLRSVEDERSPWLLFSHPDALRRRMTEAFYTYHLERKNLALMPVEQVQKFIDDEHAETMQDERYQGMYDGRLLSIPTDLLATYANDPTVGVMAPEQIEAVVNRLYNAEYKDWLEANEKRREERAVLNALDRGDVKIKGGRFEFRGAEHATSDVKALLQRVEAELEADAEWLKAFDREVLQTHLRMAQIVGDGDYDLYLRYQFHLNLQDILRVAGQEENRLANVFHFLSSKESGLSEGEFGQVFAALKEAHSNISKAYNKTRSIPLPSLQNMQPGMPLSDFLLQEPLVAPILDGSRIDGRWMSALGKQISQIEGHCRRLYFKSMGAILTRQEAIALNYRAHREPSPL
ncbi:MAG TPA: M48 family metallopeptidase [Chthonomonadaceae bacterium]|nr:M48 family metallopeptidase [Chthonomonadaceae bacterium]